MNDETRNQDALPEPDDAQGARLLALILGEMEPAERAELERELEADPDLKARYDRLAFAAERIRETLTIEKQSSSDSPAPLRLSPERRRRVLQGPAKKPSPLLRFDFNHPLVPMSVAACFILVLYSGYQWFQPDGVFGAKEVEPISSDVKRQQPVRAEEGVDISFPASEEKKDPELNLFQQEPLPTLEQDRENKELAGSNIGTQLDELGASISVFSTEFLDDIETEEIEQVSGAEFSFNRPPVSSDSTLPVPSRTRFEEPASEEVFILSPFVAEADEDAGYRATSTLAGSRLRTELKDVASSGYLATEVETLISPFNGDDEETRPIKRKIEKQGAAYGFQDGPAARTDKKAVAQAKEREAEEPVFSNIASGLLSDGSGGLADAILPSEPEPAPPPVPVSNPVLQAYSEILTESDPLSTFSLNVSDVSYRLAQASLSRSELPTPATLRTEEFVNAFDYGDPEAAAGEPIAFAWEQSRWPFGHDRDILRFSFKTASTGRSVSQRFNLVLGIDASGSMARADRREIVDTAMEALATQLTPEDTLSVVTFGRESRLLIDGVNRNNGDALLQSQAQFNPQGGTDLESGLGLAYETAQRHFSPAAINRVILLTDGAANLGNTVPEDMAALVENNRRQGIALDSFGVGFDGHDDAFLERLSRNGDGRYRFLRSAADARLELGEKFAGSLRPAAYDVKVQIEFNSRRVQLYQQLGYQKHQLRDEDFRDNAVDAAELAAAEAGNALYLAKILEDGEGEIGVARARFRDAETGEYAERSWLIPYREGTSTLTDASPSLRLAAASFGLAAKLNRSPIAENFTYQDLLELTADFQSEFPLEPRAIELRELISTARRLSGE